MSLVLVAAALAAGGCGGGSSDARSAGPLPDGSPRSQLIARADAICRRLNAQIKANKQSSLRLNEIARFAPRNAALEATALKELSKLTPPASIARDWHQVIAYRRTLMEELVKLGRYAKANNARAIHKLAASKKRVHQKLLATATRNGFKDCPQIG